MADTVRRNSVSILSFAIGISTLVAFYYPGAYFFVVLLILSLSAIIIRSRRKVQKNFVYDVFALYHNKGAEATQRYLQTKKRKLPKGVDAAFDLLLSRNEEEWLCALNEWSAVHESPSIYLAAGPERRFERIAFAPSSPVESSCLVSIIVPCYNCEETLRLAIDSLLAQTWQDIEIIAVDDCSTDNTARILGEYALKDSRVKVIHNKINVGAYVSKNRALYEARGEYVTGHDSDDIAFPNRIEIQMRAIMDGQTLGCIGHMLRLDENGIPDRFARIGSSSFDGVCRIASISLMIERNILLNFFGGWDSVRFSADSELINRINKCQITIAKINRPLMFCLWSEDSLSGNSETGVGRFSGRSNIRRAYAASYTKWHGSIDKSTSRIDFPLQYRPFSAPAKMIVAYEDVIKVVEGDAI